MQLRRAFHSKIFWGLSAKFMALFYGIILIPFMVHYFDKITLSLFYLFISFSLLTDVLDMGFSLSIVRAFTYAYSGAKEIYREGYGDDLGNEVNWILVAEIFKFAKKIYCYLGLFSCFIYFIPGSLYIYYITKNQQIGTMYVLSCWILFSAAAILAMYYNYFATLVKGRGSINQANQVIIISRGVNLILSIFLIYHGWKLLAVSFSTFSVSVVERVLYNFIAFYDTDHKKLKIIINEKSDVFKKYLFIIGHNSAKLATVSLGAYLITRATIIIATNYLGIIGAANYIFTIQIIFVITAISGAVITACVPQINSLVNNPKEQIKVFAFCNMLSILLYTIGGLIIVFGGKFLLNILHSDVTFISQKKLLILLFVYALELQHANFATLIASRNEVPFIKAAIFSGIAIVILSIILVKYFEFGVLGLILAQGVVQIVYNNWYWIYYVCKIYKVSYLYIIRNGFLYGRI